MRCQMMQRSRSYSSLTREENPTCSEEEEGDGSSVINAYEGESYSILKWPSVNKNRKPLVNFSAACVLVGTPAESLDVIRKYHLGYKFVKTECRLVRNILAAHGFKETGPNSLQFNLMWTGTHLKPYTLRALLEYQKVNHFPRSYELTRKDRLYKNIQRMQHSKGTRHFDFVPQSFVLTSELNDFYSAFLKDKGPWIVKPVASSRGRGIYIISHPSQIPVHENVLVCKYIDNPLLVNGYKFDCRLYVAVTSYDPLRLYLYEEGLARFSTVKYKKTGNLSNIWMHLTNYSVNKNSDDYIRCEDPEVDDYGSKWSFSAMLRCLRDSGKDVEVLMARIEDVIIKTIISGEMAIATACKMFVPHRGNCFELFGFDILIDENLKPWLLEVNLSPSLACDSPLDLKIKSNLITDLFNLTGFVADDPTSKKPPKLLTTEGKKKQRHASSASSSTDLKSLAIKSINKINDGLSNEERRILRETKEEAKRSGGFVRIYPSPESWELYSSLQEHQTTHNRMVHSKLYPDLWRAASQRPQSATYIARARNFSSINKPILSQSSEVSLDISRQNFHRRFLIYERKLESWSDFGQYSTNDQGHFATSTTSFSRCKPPVLAQGQLSLKPANYEENLLLKEEYHSGNVEIVKNGQHLSKFQARAAFAVYLQRVRYRLLEEISASHEYTVLTPVEEAKQEQQIDLIQKFLVKAAVNLTNPIDIVIPQKSFPIKERKKILAHQLIDFVKVYTKESEMLIVRDGTPIVTETPNSIDDETFKIFVERASECELEDILTLFTKHNKSASVFLGAKAEKKIIAANSSVMENKKDHMPNSVIHYKTSEGLSLESKGSEKSPAAFVPSHSLRRLVYGKDSSRPSSGRSSSGRSQQSQNINRRSKGTPTTNLNESSNHKRHLSADPYRSNMPANLDRPSSSKPRVRSRSADRMNQLTAACVYTGANNLLKHQANREGYRSAKRASSAKTRSESSTSSIYSTHVFGADDPKLTKALKKLSLKQTERNYSTNNIMTPDSDSNLVDDEFTSLPSRKLSQSSKEKNVKSKSVHKVENDCETLDKFIRYGQQFVVENKKTLQVDRNNYLHQTASTQTVETRVPKIRSGDSDTQRNIKSGYQNTIYERKKSGSDPNIRIMINDGLINYNEPRPPDKKKPVIKKQINPQRLNRLVGMR